MKRSPLNIALVTLALVGLVCLAGCECVGKVPAKPIVKPAPVVKAPPPPGLQTVSVAVPCLTGCKSPVMLKKTGPTEVSVGQSFDYVLEVSNVSDISMQDVVVTDQLPSGFKATATDPQPTATQGGKATWNLGYLEPGESKTIKVTGQATGPGTMENCATVTFVPRICLATKVVQPALKLEKTLPAEALLCDKIPMKLVVTNTGTGTARNVVITDDLPAGLAAADGKTKLSLAVGDLAPGQSRTFDIETKAQKTGKYNNTAVATADGNLKAQDSAAVQVLQPVLKIDKTGPNKSFIGRNVAYTVTVSNTGDAPAANLVVEDTLPAGTTFVSATEGGTMSAGKVVWNLGTLAVKGSKQLGVTVAPPGAGEYTNTAVAKAVCAQNVSASAKTVVEGIPAVLLEVIDIEDPIEVGSNETYVITVTNQGSAVDTNIRIVATLEAAQQYVSSSGATAGTAQGQVITFAPLPSLAPKAKAEWRVVAKAVQAGDIRFKVTMNTDQLGRSVDETEATHLYE